ncbi:hypothetical protein [Actinoplanes derwentensis]|uniref:Uncharacterized protein n=1 Tax=Actinoplanes derwentensis TaxID=113562 RepID=A0A1H1V4I8_9ACTN|nr:hypothetical protein [Actinoplanes derwentensis]GID90515.1 hypothetical protein Ade03nite_94390 [Actinoplanes derwentensis]SDS79169.1 hypothetical protein SAMN04489716_1626 [Actinoplanes derwentensis]
MDIQSIRARLKAALESTGLTVTDGEDARVQVPALLISQPAGQFIEASGNGYTLYFEVTAITRIGSMKQNVEELDAMVQAVILAADEHFFGFRGCTSYALANINGADTPCAVITLSYLEGVQ